ncbi:hypothetical protein [Plastoroseomonas hellenica]|uniref:hypothetical protein n=1 Tax=Plastoroseomonas hellenica TaxID=2687306 RepID=UPI001BAA86D1|nr:hypothetical protein [Plastoroseomonas hellenica]MBR0641369.1 hypothetical protein [Plastoroseomonas hellenica]
MLGARCLALVCVTGHCPDGIHGRLLTEGLVLGMKGQAMSGYRLTDPGAATYGYRPPANLLGDYRLRLRPEFEIAARGWVAQPRFGPLTPVSVPVLVDSALRPTLSEAGRDVASAPKRDPTEVAAARLRRANAEFWDKLQQLLRDTEGMQEALGDVAKDSLWPSQIVPGRINAATGENAEGGKIRPDGTVDHGDVHEQVPGLRLKQPGPFVWMGRRFGLASDIDVFLFVFADKDALATNRPDLLLSGGGVEAKGRTSSGNEVTVVFGAGRDAAGGPAAFLSFGFAPKSKEEKK